MHLQNQHTQNFYYYSYQNPTLIPNHATQTHAASFPYPRIQSAANIYKPTPENQLAKNRTQVYQTQSELQFGFRKQLNKLNNYSSQNTFSRHTPHEYTNPQTKQLYAHKYGVPYSQLQNNQKNKYLSHTKRKQANSYNSSNREIRDQYYRVQANQQQVKQPQQQYHNFIKTNANKMSHMVNMSPQVKVKDAKQPKKTTSPFKVHTRSSSYKQSINQNQIIKRIDSLQNQQGKKSKQVLKFNSPMKINYQMPKNFKDIQAKMRMNTQRTQQSISVSKKQTTPQTSNSTSMMFESSIMKQPNLSYKQNCPVFLNKQTKIQNSCQVNLSEQSNRKQVLRFIEANKKLQEQLDRQKVSNHQKDIRIKNLQHEINSQKNTFQRRILMNEKQNSSKRQSLLIQIKQENQLQIIKIISELKQKSMRQIKDAQLVHQCSLADMKRQYQSNKLELTLRLTEHQKIIADCKVKNTEFQKLKIILQAKIEKIEAQLADRNQTIQVLTLQQKNWHKPKEDKSTNTSDQSGLIKNANLKMELNSENLIQKNKVLQQKLTNYLINIDKYSQKYKQCKSQVQKLQRKVQEFSALLFEKDGIIKNMSRDLKSRDKFIMDLRRNNDVLQSLNKSNSESLIKFKCQTLNLKYKNANEC